MQCTVSSAELFFFYNDTVFLIMNYFALNSLQIDSAQLSVEFLKVSV